ncbi:MAG TPA: hypothetical protein VGM05_33740 [Planctomycetaceae bacterium]|jgi:hypothetical protein
MDLRAEFIEKASTDLKATIDENDYWTIREQLLEQQKIETGRGKGGSVRRVPEQSAPAIAPPITPTEAYAKEAELYPAFHATIREFFPKTYRIKLFVSEITASQGRRQTGGMWTRPDVTLIAVRMYKHLPGKSLDINTFEVKPAWAYGIDGVYETASHSAFANRSYLAIHAPKDLPDNELDRLERECERFGVGLILFADPKSLATFDLRVEPKFNLPDPDAADAFIETQISKQNHDELRTWTK